VTNAVGVDLGGTHVRAALVDADGVVVAERSRATPDSLEAILATIVDHVTELTRGATPGHVSPPLVGVGAAGMVDPEGTIHYAPNVTPLVGAKLASLLEGVLGTPVAVDNDANVAALAELTYGAARGCDDMLLVTIGTGTGGGIVCGGRVLRGAHGFAGEIGHFQVDPDGPLCACGERGHWEAVASGTALGALGRARARAGRAPALVAAGGGTADGITGTVIGDAALAGEPVALEVVEEFAVAVAIGLAGLANIFDPEMIVVGGGLVELGDRLLEPVRAAFAGRLEGATRRPAVPIVAAELGSRAGVVGAALLAARSAGVAPDVA
jgi:glucokinase